MDEIKQVIKECLDGKKPWYELQVFLLQYWHEEVPADMEDLINSIKLRFAEYTSGHWSKEDFHARLLEIYEGREWNGK